jgi:hypothetical protein
MVFTLSLLLDIGRNPLLRFRIRLQRNNNRE